MEVIIQFFNSIANFFLAIWNFIKFFIEEIISFTKLLIKVPAMFKGALSWIPEDLMYYLLILLSIIVVYKLLGREG